jgi:hypothetical protein
MPPPPGSSSAADPLKFRFDSSDYGAQMFPFGIK